MRWLKSWQSKGCNKRLPGVWLSTFLLVMWGLFSGCSPVPKNPTLTPGTSPVPRASTSPSPLSPSRLTPTHSPLATHTLTPTSPTPLPSATPSPWFIEVTFGVWEQVSAVAWSADGKLLAASAGEHIVVLETLSFQTQQVMEVNSWSDRLAFTPAPGLGMPYLLAVAAKDGKVQLWDALTGRQIVAWEAHKKGAKSVAFDPTGSSLASSGGDAMLRLWDVQALIEYPAENPVPQAEMIGGAYVIPDVSFSPDGHLIASVDIHDIRLRDPSTQRLVRTLRGDRSIFRIAFSPDGSRLAAGEIGNRLSLWDLAKGELARQWSASSGQAGDEKVFLWGLVFSPDGKWIAAGGSDGMITLWEIPTGQIAQRFQAHSRAVAGLAFSPDGRWLASGGLDGILRIWKE